MVSTRTSILGWLILALILLSGIAAIILISVPEPPKHPHKPAQSCSQHGQVVVCKRSVSP